MSYKISTAALTSFAHFGRGAAKKSRTTAASRFYSPKIELDLLDVMLDLDPGALVWSPRRHGKRRDDSELA